VETSIRLSTYDIYTTACHLLARQLLLLHVVFLQLLRVTQVSTFTEKCARVPCAQSAEGFVQCHLHVDGSEQQIVLLQVPLDPAESAVVKRRAVKAIGRRVQQDAAGSVDQR